MLIKVFIYYPFLLDTSPEANDSGLTLGISLVSVKFKM